MHRNIVASSGACTSEAALVVCISPLCIRHHVIHPPRLTIYGVNTDEGEFPLMPLKALKTAWSGNLKSYFCLERERVVFFVPEFFC